jgi:hypothetical protein
MPAPAGGYEDPATLPDWAPTVLNVADYLPHRTLAQDLTTNTQGEDVYELTFDDTTRPTGTIVTRLIADGVSWVTSRVYPLNTLSEPMAGVLVKLWASAWIERSWPADDSSLERARDFEKRIDLMLADLVAANDVANGTGDYGIDVLPMWSGFPPADCRYDNASYW